jgi:DNA-directed RNA polymerase specialized sigma24 family protein
MAKPDTTTTRKQPTRAGGTHRHPSAPDRAAEAPESDEVRAFTRFVKEVEPRLSYAFAAAYGPETGAEVTADTLEWAWAHWAKVQPMENAAGYLYRVGQSKARWYHRPTVLFPELPRAEVPTVCPELPAALGTLSKHQRVAVVLIHGLGYSEREVADLVGISRWSVRTHAERGLKRLRSSLGVRDDA